MAAASAAPGRTLLDVGSGSVGIAPWLDPAWEVTAIDRDFNDYGSATGPAKDGLAERVRGDVLALPFADASFDVCVALDILEHLRPADRSRAASELARVTRRRLIVGCPAGEEALACDRRLLDRIGEGEPPGWLREHLANGFPTPEELGSMFAPYGSVRLLPNESVSSHERLVRIELPRAGSVASRALTRLARPLLRDGASSRRWAVPLVRRLLRGGDREPSYRTIAIVDFASPAAGDETAAG